MVHLAQCRSNWCQVVCRVPVTQDVEGEKGQAEEDFVDVSKAASAVV